jgi:hypothetical protein
MPATIGVTNLDGYTPPVGTVAKKCAVKATLGTLKYRNELGLTIRNIPLKIVATEQTIDLIGAAPLSAVTAAAFVADTYKITSIRVSETAEGVPESTVTRMKFATAA